MGADSHPVLVELGQDMGAKRIAKLISGLLALFFFNGTGPGSGLAAEYPKEAVKAMSLAQRHLKAKAFDRAASVLETYMKEAGEPIPLPAYQILARAWFEQNEIETAKKIYEKARKSFPKSQHLLRNLAILTYETGDLTKAGDLFEQLFFLEGSIDLSLLYQSAQIYFQAKEYKKSKKVFARLLGSKTQIKTEWIRDMISVCLCLDDLACAEQWTKKLLEKHPGQEKYWDLLARIRLGQKEYKRAAAALEVALAMGNAGADQWIELSDLYLYLNAPLMAARAMEKAFGKNLTVKQRLGLARIYAKSLRYDKALSCLDEAIQASPSGHLFLEKGRILYGAGRYSEAMNALDLSIQTDPVPGEAYILAGFAAWNLKALERAKRYFALAAAKPEFTNQAKEAVRVLEDLLAPAPGPKALTSRNTAN